ncbi:VOC family protein [Brachybacterium sp. JHP9]|uniref:Bleomycin resistance protein n=1 Tax=Brachybacterium equifaecis TaxID=2910770 RepID=A0ABT0R2J7_9MICO|nr:VOC family protein [Brachybacterium equifaecis]MCL6424142.1 VOC family protein [Brachybacterium equifaecis]
MSDMLEPALVPELLVADLEESLAFWVGIAGFSISYDRPEERFAYLALGSAHLMLEQEGVGRNWITGPLERPLGRGINLQISVFEAQLETILAGLGSAGRTLFMEPETRWYRVGEQDEAGVRQFLVTDPDGYLVRFQALGGAAVSGLSGKVGV